MPRPMRLLRHQRKALYFLPELEERALRQTRGALQKAQERLEQRQREVASANADPAMHRLFIQEIVPKINQIKTGQRFGYREALGQLAQQPENSLLRDAIADATVRVLKEHPFIINKIPRSRKTEDLRESATHLVDGWLTTFIERKRDYRTIRPETERVNLARQQLEKRLKELEPDRPKIEKALSDIDAYLKERQANLTTRKRITAFLKSITGMAGMDYNFQVKERLMQYSEVKIRELLGALSKKWLAEFNRGYNNASGGKEEGCLYAGYTICQDLLSGDWKKKVDFPKPSKERLSGARQGFKTLRELGLRSPRKKQA